jgi:hypothetical protein
MSRSRWPTMCTQPSSPWPSRDRLLLVRPLHCEVSLLVYRLVLSNLFREPILRLGGLFLCVCRGAGVDCAVKVAVANPLRIAMIVQCIT